MQKGACSIPPPTTRRLLATAWRVDSAMHLPITKRPESLTADLDARCGEEILDPWPRTALRVWPRYRSHALHLKNH